MIDFHCHILPGLDDGAKNIEESLAMAKIAEEDGIQALVCTPHLYEESYDTMLETATPRFEELEQRLIDSGSKLKLIFGAEVHVAPELPAFITRKKIPLIGGRYILLELPFNEVPGYMKHLIFELRIAGVTPIIAHPERNIVLADDPNILLTWLEQGALAQVNAGSIIGIFGHNAAQTAEIMLTHHMVHFIGSDAHHAEGRRTPMLSPCRQALEEMLGKEQAEDLLTNNPTKAIAGHRIRRREPEAYCKPKVGFWGRVMGRLG